MRDASMEPVGERVRLRFERELSAPPGEVWRALTDREELAAWFPCDVLTDGWRVGAELRFAFRGGEGPDLVGTVLECGEPQLLAFTWGAETLRFELCPSNGGTRLVLTDELDPPIAARNAAGWDGCLDRLEGHLPEAGAWRTRFDRYVTLFEPMLGQQEGPPAGRA